MSLPDLELIEQAKDALAMFIKFSDLWLEKVSYRPDSWSDRSFKNRVWNANSVVKQTLARLNDDYIAKWQIGRKSSISSSVEE